MTEKEEFIEKMKARTHKFAVDVILFCNSLIPCKASDVITYQLVKAATSVGANYRAACKARSRNEFFSKICIVAEEADESEYWLTIIRDTDLSDDKKEEQRLLNESIEISKIMTAAKNSTYDNRHH